jgi:NADH-quinone oxidoreductase subunit N
MKYFFLSIFSSALLLYGLAMIYGISGTTLIAGSEDPRGIRELLAGPNAANPLIGLAPLAIVLVVAGLGFKLAIAPLQFYAPDVYQGTTNANAGLLAVAPKIAGIAGLIRLALVAMPAAGDFGWQLALILAVLTMTIGNICALWQNNLRRLMAYSSIAHGGYLLIGLAAAALATTPSGMQFTGGIAAMLVYVAVYAIATMGTFAALAYLGSKHRELSGVDDLVGLARSQPLAAGLIAVFMFSLAGIPPLAGFWGKLALFSTAVEVAAGSSVPATSLWFTLLAVIGAANAAIAAAYYLRIVAVMYFQPATAETTPAGGIGALSGAVLCGVLVVLCGVLPGPAMNSATEAEATLRRRAPIVHRQPTPPAVLTAAAH